MTEPTGEEAAGAGLDIEEVRMIRRTYLVGQVAAGRRPNPSYTDVRAEARYVIAYVDALLAAMDSADLGDRGAKEPN